MSAREARRGWAKRAWGWALAAVAAGCAGGGGEEPPVATRAAALQVPGLTPVPCDLSKTPVWDGTPVQLMLADAWAECTVDVFRLPGPNELTYLDLEAALIADDAIVDVFARMETTLAVWGASTNVGSSAVEGWFQARSGANNCDPAGSSAGGRVAVPLRTRVVVEAATNAFNAGTAEAGATHELRTAGINLCVAQVLRERSPGAAGGEALLLTAEEQRELAAATRERVQVAMLQYALLGSAFAGPAGAPASASFTAAIPALQSWIAAPKGRAPGTGSLANLTTDDLRRMGRDFAAAVQLHAVVSEEYLTLLARSRSARLPYSEAGKTAGAEAEWGYGSWHHRLRIAAYGGDALAAGPWEHPGTVASPAPTVSTSDQTDLLLSGVRSLHAEPPFVGGGELAPEVGQLLQLARRFDEVELALGPAGANGCRAVDVGASAARLFDGVEDGLHRLHCLLPVPPPGTPTDVCGALPEPLAWSLYRITREHAKTLAQRLAEYVGPSVHPDGRTGCGEAMWHRGGALAPSAGCTSAECEGAVIEIVGNVLHVGKQVAFGALGDAEVMPAYSSNAALRLAEAHEILPGAVHAKQGFGNVTNTANPVNYASSAKRRIGVIPAMGITRTLLEAAEEAAAALPAGARKTNTLAYLEQGAKMRAVLAGGGASTSVALVPRVQQSGTDVRPYFGFFAGGGEWDLRVSADPDDPFWQPPNGEGLHAVVAYGDVGASDLLAASTVEVLGRSASSALAAGTTAVVPMRRLAGVGVRWTTGNATCNLLFGCGSFALGPNRPGGLSSPVLTLAVWRATPAERAALTPRPGTIRVVASRVLERGVNARRGQYFGYGGSLADSVSKQSEPDPFDPSRHRYDAFGLEERWVPPFSAELLGGTAGEGSAQYYLAAARQAADAATGAVNLALDELLAEAVDEQSLETAARRSEQALNEANESLCGSVTPDCDVDLPAPSALPVSWYPALNGADTEPPENACAGFGAFPEASQDDLPMPPLETPVGPIVVPGITTDFDSEDPEKAGGLVDCFVKERIASFLATSAQIAEPVRVTVDPASASYAAGAPAFAEYSGGSLQQAFIEQWSAVRSPDEDLRTLLATRDEAKARFSLAQAIISRAELRVKNECGINAFARALAAGYSFGIPKGLTFSAGPLLAQVHACEQATFDAGPDLASAGATVRSAFTAVAAASEGLTVRQAAIASSGAQIARLVNEHRLAKARVELEAELSKTAATTSFGLYRRYRSYDLWRARALLENARRYALAARRAIEARYAVDLSSLTRPEAFVAAPSTWADEVYEYDLSLPAAVGLAVGSEAPGGIYSNKVTDYVTNLEGFVMGYAATRPTAVAHEDVDVVHLPGLTTELTQPGLSEDWPAALVLSASDQAWTARCAGAGDSWVAVPAPEAGGVRAVCRKQGCGCVPGEELQGCLDRCYEPPAAVRLAFQLDPWGRVGGSFADPPYEQRYNARWGRLAVNLVGTGIRQCDLAADPLACHGEGHVRFDLRHVGRPWVTDFGGAWRALGLPIARIEGGKALAAELWIDPLRDGWASSYIAPVARTELFYRPLGGSYELELTSSPELRLDRIERVQLLIGTTYWVAQQ